VIIEHQLENRSMTEDEAKTKACPYAATFGASQQLADGPGPHCVGSACMAWRERHQWFDNAQQEPSWVSYYPYAFEPGPGQERDDGFCGLAGSPA
jgi:hypothetical protein